MNPTDSPNPTPSPSNSPSKTISPTNQSNKPSAVPTLSREPSKSAGPSATKFPSESPSISDEPSYTSMPSRSPSVSNAPSMTEFPSASTFCSASRSDALVLSMEYFNDGILNGWTGVSSTTTLLGQSYLQFDVGDKPTKSVKLPSGTRNVHVEFLFYEIRSWDGNNPNYGPDKFFVYVNNRLLDLGLFQLGVNESSQGYTNAIRWQHQTISNIPSVVDVHTVVLDIPEMYLTSGTLTLGFQAATKDSGPLNEPGGLDNLKIVACSA